jgi:Methyltransferase domain
MMNTAELLRANAEGRVIVTEYPYNPRERMFEQSIGGQRIRALCDRSREEVSGWLSAAYEHLPAFRSVLFDGDPNGPEPFWNNGMIPGLDGVMLYTIVRTIKPNTYLEVGSGSSTKFVAKAIRDGNLSTRIISIDPFPRAVVDHLCSEVIREPFENVDPSRYLSKIDKGDVVYIDNSHRSFQNSDVSVFFTEMLPALPHGVIYGIHDIFLPKDYPSQWSDRFYNEQYLLASYLLGGAGGDRIVFPGLYTSTTHAETINILFSSSELTGVSRHAGAFWMLRGG